MAISQPIFVPSASSPAITPVVTSASSWRIIVCDADGNQISNITKLAKNKQFQFRLNRPATLSFTVASDDPLIYSNYSDGYPVLDTLRRTIKAYRYEGGQYVLRFAGYVSQIQDQGDANTATSAVTVYDPLQRLARRRTRDASGSATNTVTFTSTDGAQIAKTLIDRTNTYAGNVGIATTGTFETTTVRTVDYSLKSVGDAVSDLTAAYEGFDIAVDPVDQTDGVLAVMSAYITRGSLQSNAVFSWGLAGHNVVSITRLSDGELVANNIYGLGTATPTQLISNKFDSTSQSTYGVYEDVTAWSDVSNQDYLDALTQEELNLRANPRDVVSIVPQAGLPSSLTPWDDYWLGDTYYVYVGPRLRGGFAGLQRCYGVDLQVDDNAIERVTSILSSPTS